MIKQHRTIYKTIKSRAETFVGCIFDEIARRLWSRHLHRRDAARARYREKKRRINTYRHRQRERETPFSEQLSYSSRWTSKRTSKLSRIGLKSSSAMKTTSFWYSREGEVCGFPRALSRIKFL